MNSPRPFAELESLFQAECGAAIEAARKLGYEPSIFAEMCARVGAAEAARRLLVSGDIQTGFHRLVALSRPELTIEWVVLSERWSPLFSDQHRQAARWRLQAAGVALPTTS